MVLPHCDVVYLSRLLWKKVGITIFFDFFLSVQFGGNCGFKIDFLINLNDQACIDLTITYQALSPAQHPCLHTLHTLVGKPWSYNVCFPLWFLESKETSDPSLIICCTNSVELTSWYSHLSS